MINIIKILLSLFIIFTSIHADDSKSWFNTVKTYSQDKIHDMVTMDITFKSFYGTCQLCKHP